MSFASIDRILAKIEQQSGWEEFRQYRYLLESWAQIVGETTAIHTRPLYIQRQILWVATSSSARAQELSFQRYSLLKKINSHSVFTGDTSCRGNTGLTRCGTCVRTQSLLDRRALTLKDLKFSTSRWISQSKKEPVLEIKVNTKQDKQIAVIDTTNIPYTDLLISSAIASNKTLELEPAPQAAVKDWIKSLEKKRRELPSCPQCQVPTPKEELLRWHCCHHCIAKKWSIESQNLDFTNTSKNK